MSNYIKIPLDDPLGSLMLGTFFNAMLYSHEIVLMLQYFRNARKDGWFLPAMMAVLFANDTFATATEVFCVYSYCISNWGNIAYLSYQYWPIAQFCIGTGISAFICHAFLVHRVHKLTRKVYYTIPLALATCAAFAGTLWAGYEQVVNKLYAERSKGDAAVSMWLIASAVADAGICAVLLVFLYKARKVASQFEGSNLVGPLMRMMFLTIETGGLTAVIAVIALGFYVKDPSSNVAVGLGFVLGRLYALTILFCLAQRGSSQRDGIGATSTHGATGYATKGRTTAGFGGRTVDGVAVTHQATVVIDEPNDHELASFAARSGAGGRKQAAFAAPPAQMYMIGTAEEDEADEKRSLRRGDMV